MGRRAFPAKRFRMWIWAMGEHGSVSPLRKETTDCGVPARPSCAGGRRFAANSICLAVLGALVVLANTIAQGAAPPGPGPCPGPSLESPELPPESRPWTDPSLPPETRAALLLGHMALEEKIDMATGEPCGLHGFYNAAIPRLGIPALTMADGPAGVRINNPAVNSGKATALPSPTALAATWDLALAQMHGDVLGREAFATGHNVLLGPSVNLTREVRWGRSFEGFGEDPILAARMAVPLIQSIQQHPVMANAKHYHVYNQETDRFELNAQIGERPLREIYTPPFEAAVRQGGVASVMCSFNQINGIYMCENYPLLTELLKGELGFDGFVLSDYAAT
jgi:beta-glucosidase